MDNPSGFSNVRQNINIQSNVCQQQTTGLFSNIINNNQEEEYISREVDDLHQQVFNDINLVKHSRISKKFVNSSDLSYSDVYKIDLSKVTN